MVLASRGLVQIPRASLLFRRAFSANSHHDASARLSISKLLETSDSIAKSGSPIMVEGWVRSVRKMKNVGFASIGDGSTIHGLQVVLEPSLAKQLATGTSVRITGHVKESEGTKQKIEFLAEEVNVLGEVVPETYPLQKKYHTTEYLRSIPHMRPRLPANALVMQIRSQVLSSINTFFGLREFVQTQPPIITSSDCEGAGEVFRIAPQGREHHFKTEKYLTVSTQLHLEALCQAVGKVWTLSPSFRAEKSDTNRHLSEFYMLEAELGFTQTLEDVLSLCEDLIRFIVHDFRQSRFSREWLSTKEGSEIELLEARWNWLLTPTQWRRMSYTEAVKLLQEADVPFRFKPEWGLGLQAEHERYLAENFGATDKDSTTTAGPIFITDYPKTLKPFYMLENQSSSSAVDDARERQETVACFDLLFPGLGEVAGGSLREHRFREIVDSMKRHGLVSQDATDETLGAMQWYADLRRWGSIEHGGFGIGFDRLLSWLIGIENVREVVTFPRWHGKCEC